MISDFEQDNLGTQVQADICLIGAGAAGIAIAREFIGTDISVLVLEGGGNLVEPKSQEPYQSVITGLKHLGTHAGRARALGGTTTLWAGQALPLFPIDFVKRDWVPFSGWPMERTELEPFYPRAEDVMGVPHATYDESSWPRNERPLADRESGLNFCYSQFAPQPNFAIKYRSELANSTNVNVLLHANVTSLVPCADATGIQRATIRSFNGNTADVVAKLFIVCCGAIDTARLLLASNTIEKSGVGNRFENVGAFFQDHPTVRIPISPYDPVQFDLQYSAVRTASKINMIKFHPTDKFQFDHKILNVGAEVVHEDAQENNAIAAARRLYDGIAGRRKSETPVSDLLTVLGSPVDLAKAALRKAAGKNSRSSTALRHFLLVSCEQEPSRDSRIEIGTEKDCLGMPKAVVHWAITESVSRSVCAFVQALSAIWDRQKVARIDLDPGTIQGRELGLHGGYSDFNHHIGTTRMGRDVKTSVVDPNCKVHGYKNLYIASSSVFPTGSFSNPTLTMLALCYRLADEVKRELRQTAASL